jgi:hypothetical protein
MMLFFTKPRKELVFTSVGQIYALVPFTTLMLIILFTHTILSRKIENFLEFSKLIDYLIDMY